MSSLTKHINAPGRKQSGFTLIEIAIVLVIIGLLLGGVLKGQELITTARVHALNNTADGITAAWFSFQDRYRAFPGDYSQADVNLTSGPINGNGNGQVDTDAERTAVWIHLVKAGYLTGDFNDDTVVTVIDEYGCLTANCPDNGFGYGMVISYSALAQSAAGVSAHELISGHGIPVQVLAELDRKIDDGLAGSGVMQLGQGGTNWDATAETACENGVNYGLLTPSADCAAVFRNF